MRNESVRIYNPISRKMQTLHIHAWFGDCRDGFNHYAECDEYPSYRRKIHYINRTWECHPYDTVIADCVEKIKDELRKSANRQRRAQRRRDNLHQLTLGI